MKSKFIALSLLAGGMLFAEDYYNNDMQDQRCGCSSCSSCSSCCSSSPCTSCSSCSTCCCVPKPKKCINCECYTPKFYDLQCAWDVFVDVEFLYWYARETNLAYAQKVRSQLRTFPQDILLDSPFSLNVGPDQREYFHTKWDPGFRVGLGWNSSCDGWDVYLSWTWFSDKKRNSSTVNPFGEESDESLFFSFRFPSNGQSALINPWVNGGFETRSSLAEATDMTRFWASVSAKWKLWLNSIDLEFGRKYWLSKCFAMRPYIGLRGAWTKTHFDTTSSLSSPFSPVVGGGVDGTLFKDQFRNRYWGVGFLAGVQPTWYFTPCFALYGNFDAALIWGKFQVKKRENYFDAVTGGTIPVTFISFSNKSRDDFFMMQSIIDLAIGIRWEDTWCCDRFRSTLDLGWEHHIWFDHNHRFKTFDAFRTVFREDPSPSTIQGYRNFEEVAGNLMFGGLVVRLRFDF